jgi:predicted GH43/DUF377 family glycosyl hydrolase
MVGPIKKTTTKAPATKPKTVKKAVTVKKRAIPKAKPKVRQKPKKESTVKKLTPLNLTRADANPIIKPSHYPNWESQATFNPSAIYHDGKIHIVYRAVGLGDTSVLGYAQSDDGITISRRHPMPMYHSAMYEEKREIADKSNPSIAYLSGGGGSGGCEDPRLTKIDDMIYMLYTAFDGWGSVRIAMSSISLDDFINEDFHWKKPVLISPPGQINKNWVIFPEKIHGKFAILHSVYPNIRIDYFDSLDELDGQTFIHSNNTRPIDPDRQWDSWFRGVGPAPIMTKYGWLVIYHAMDHRNPDRYRMGALILDSDDPTKILYRSTEPILEPEEQYENNGYKWGVIYSCGAIVKDGALFVYYGGADMVSCVAVADLDSFLKELIKKGGSPKLSTKKISQTKKKSA